MPDSHTDRLSRARTTLEGLSIGDAFGGYATRAAVRQRTLPPAPWHYTDDTMMALSIYSILRQKQMIDQDALALNFAAHFDKSRGYGPGMRKLLPAIMTGEPWREGARRLFKGEGSLGNGGAMRIAPLAGYFADDLAAVVDQARRATEITHAHPEGVAGGIAAAVAGAIAWEVRARNPKPTRAEFIDRILPHIPAGMVHDMVQRARDLPSPIALKDVIAALGNGSAITAMDTVGYCLWCAGEQLGRYEEAIWLTASGGGDVDTNCAIVGGIVSLSTGIDGIPANWQTSREPLPAWAFEEVQ